MKTEEGNDKVGGEGVEGTGYFFQTLFSLSSGGTLKNYSFFQFCLSPGWSPFTGKNVKGIWDGE